MRCWEFAAQALGLDSSVAKCTAGLIQYKSQAHSLQAPQYAGMKKNATYLIAGYAIFCWAAAQYAPKNRVANTCFEPSACVLSVMQHQKPRNTADFYIQIGLQPNKLSRSKLLKM
jgi:hypothetical protein